MLRSIHFRGPPPGTAPRDPFDLPALAGVDELALDAPVVFLAGENGSGKSTLLEALAVACELPTLGAAPAHRDPSLARPAELAATLRLAWTKRARRGFFLRAEDVFGFLEELGRTRALLQRELGQAEERLAGSSDYARMLGTGPYRGSLAAMQARYGADPDARSHGELFLHLFRERLVPEGLYLMDEPEAALSPQSQLALVALMADTVRVGGQFVIATHSPILLAIPDALIYSFDECPLRPVAWADLPSVRLWRDVLAAPERYLRRLWETA